MNLMGYDNLTKEFTSVWVDNMGTGTSVVKGPYDEDTKTITLNGTMVDPMSGNEMKIKEVLHLIDDNHHVFEMFVDQGAENFLQTYLGVSENIETIILSES